VRTFLPEPARINSLQTSAYHGDNPYTRYFASVKAILAIWLSSNQEVCFAPHYGSSTDHFTLILFSVSIKKKTRKKQAKYFVEKNNHKTFQKLITTNNGHEAVVYICKYISIHFQDKVQVRYYLKSWDLSVKV